MGFNLKKIKQSGFSAFLSLIITLSLGFAFPVYSVDSDNTRILTDRKPGKPIMPTGKGETDTKLPPDAIPSTLGDIQALVLPEAFGTIKEVFQGSRKDTFVFYIQDVHASFDVQQNIAKVIQHINRNYFNDQIDLIAVEGAKGDIDLSLLKAAPEKRAVKKTSDYLMQQAYMTGAEYYSVNFKPESLVYGIEEAPLYFNNLEAFRETITGSLETEPVFNKFQASFYQLLDKIAPLELKEMYEKQAAYEKNKLSLSQYCLYIKKLGEKYSIDFSNHPNLANVLNAIELESTLDFNELEQQQTRLIQTLQQLKNSEITQALIQKGLDFRTGKIQAHTYYRYLLETAGKQDLDVNKDFPLVYQYGKLTYLQSQIKPPILFQELDWAVAEIKNKMLTKKSEKQLDELKTKFELLNAMRELKLSRSQWEEVQKDKIGFNLQDWLGFMTAEAAIQGLDIDFPVDIASLEKTLAAPEQFYRDAVARDKVIADNLIKVMEQKGKKAVVLVTGGFHTKGVAEKIKAKDISYAVITPRMEKTYNDQLYLDRMMGEALALPVNWPNELAQEVGVNDALREGVANSIETAFTLTVASLYNDSFDKAGLESALASLEEQNITIVPLPDQNSIAIEYNDKGGRRVRAVIRIVRTAENNFVYVLEEIVDVGVEGGPAAFQGALADGLASDYKLTESQRDRGVTSVKGETEFTRTSTEEELEAFKDSLNTRTIVVDGIFFEVDPDLLSAFQAAGFTQEQVRNLIIDAIDFDVDSARLRSQLEGESIHVVLFDQSENVAEDNLNNGLIGFNRALFDQFEEQPDLLKVVFQTAFVHELRHEAEEYEGIQDTPENLARFEAAQVPKDTALFFALANDAGIQTNYETFEALATLFEADSPFIVQTAARVALAFNIARQDESIEDALTDGGGILAVFDNAPTPEQVDAFSALGAVEGFLNDTLITENPPAVIIDVDQLADPNLKANILQGIENLIARFDQPVALQIYLVKGTGAATTEELDVFQKDLPATASFTSIERQPGVDNLVYAQAIANQLKTDKIEDVRIYAGSELFAAILGFVQDILKTNAVTIRLTQAEYDRLIQALRALGASGEKVIAELEKVKQDVGEQVILELPEEVIINGEYMNTLELARRTLAIQA